MNLAEALATALADVPALAPLESRIRPGARAQDDPLPALVYTIASDMPDEDLDGANLDGPRTATVNLELISEDFNQGIALTRAIEAALIEARDDSQLAGLALHWVELGGAQHTQRKAVDGSDTDHHSHQLTATIRYYED